MIFDSLGHATISGKWLDSNIDATFSRYSRELEENSYIGGLVVGLSGKNLYDHEQWPKIL